MKKVATIELEVNDCVCIDGRTGYVEGFDTEHIRISIGKEEIILSRSNETEVELIQKGPGCRYGR